MKEKQTKEVYTTREKMQGKVHIFGATQQTCKQCMARTVKIERKTTHSGPITWIQAKPKFISWVQPQTFLCRPPNTRAKAPWPIRSAWPYSNSPTLCIPAAGGGSPLTPVGNLHNPRSLLTEPLSGGAEVAKGKKQVAIHTCTHISAAESLFFTWQSMLIWWCNVGTHIFTCRVKLTYLKTPQ